MTHKKSYSSFLPFIFASVVGMGGAYSSGVEARAAPKWEKTILVATFDRHSSGNFGQGEQDLHVVQGKNLERLVPAASLIKMLSCYVVFDALKQGRLSLDQAIPIPQEVTRFHYSKFSRLPRETTHVTVREAIVGMMAQSNNYLTYALAVAVSGSEEEFTQKMEQAAKRIGLTHTREVHTSTGLPIETEDDRFDTMTTGSDMVRLAIRLRQDFPEYEDLLAQRKASVNGHFLRIGRTSLTRIKGIDSSEWVFGKTGSLSGCKSALMVLEDHVIAVLCAKTLPQRNRDLVTSYRSLMEKNFISQTQIPDRTLAQ